MEMSIFQRPGGLAMPWATSATAKRVTSLVPNAGSYQGTALSMPSTHVVADLGTPVQAADPASGSPVR